MTQDEKCWNKYPNDEKARKLCLKAVRLYFSKKPSSSNNLKKSERLVDLATKISNINPSIKNRLKRLAESAKTRHQLKRLTSAVDSYLERSKQSKRPKRSKACSGRKKTYCNKSNNCKWKKSKGCVNKSSRKTYVRSKDTPRKQRKVKCSGKRKSRCNNMVNCRWNKKKSRCRRVKSYHVDNEE